MMFKFNVLRNFYWFVRIEILSASTSAGGQILVLMTCCVLVSYLNDSITKVRKSYRDTRSQSYRTRQQV